MEKFFGFVGKLTIISFGLFCLTRSSSFFQNSAPGYGIGFGFFALLFFWLVWHSTSKKYKQKADEREKFLLKQHANTVAMNEQKAGQAGFSLIELLVVVGIILILAAIAIPNLLRARIAANEGSAVSSLRTINTAEVSYQMAYPNVGFSVDLASLGPGAGNVTCPAAPSSTAACLIDGVLSTGAKSGYTLGYASVANNGINTTYGVGAVPQVFNQTGVRQFCSAEDAVIRWAPGAAAATPTTTSAGCTATPFVPLQ